MYFEPREKIINSSGNVNRHKQIHTLIWVRNEANFKKQKMPLKSEKTIFSWKELLSVVLSSQEGTCCSGLRGYKIFKAIWFCLTSFGLVRG